MKKATDADNANGKSSRKIPSNVHVFSLTFLHFAAAVGLFLTAMALGIRFMPDLAQNAGFRGPEGWTLAHMMLLGWATLLAMGASFQIVQIILQTSLYSRSLGFVQFFLYAVGLAVMLPSLFHGAFVGLVAGGSCVAAAILLYAFNLTVTMIRRRKWNVFVFGIGWGLLDLIATAGFGVCMGVMAESGRGAAAYESVFLSHLWVGLGGWMSGLVLTFIFKLLPMFLVSPNRSEKGAWGVVGFFQAGIWMQVGWIWSGLEAVRFVSILCLAVAIVLLIRFIYTVRKGARSAGGTVPVVACLIAVTSVLFGGWFAHSLLFPGSADAGRWAAAFAVFLVAGCFSASILGFLARIVPFLWWAYRFHTKWQKKNRILLSDMLSERRMRIELLLYIAAVAVVALSVAFSAPVAAIVGQAAAVLLAVIYLLELVSAFRH